MPLPKRAAKVFETIPDARPAVRSVTVTLSTPAGTPTKVEFPLGVTWWGFRLRPTTGTVRFTVYGNVEAESTAATAIVDADDFNFGGIAHAGEWTTRLVDNYGPGFLWMQLVGATDGEVVEVEIF